MSPSEQTYKAQTVRLRNSYVSALRSERDGFNTMQAWARFASEMVMTLKWAGMAKAAALRFRATGETVRIDEQRDPGFDPQALDLGRIIRENPWIENLSIITDERIRMLVAFVVEREQVYARKWAAEERAKVKTKMDRELIPMHRLESFYRQGVKEITTVSEQVVLAEPEVDDKFPFWEYVTKDDARVRPTHAAAHGLVICRWNDEGIRLLEDVMPPNGWGCRCAGRHMTKFEAIRRGFMGHDYTPGFAYKWSSSQARRNYDIGAFPDRGWGNERNKYVAVPRIVAPTARRETMREKVARDIERLRAAGVDVSNLVA